MSAASKYPTTLPQYLRNLVQSCQPWLWGCIGLITLAMLTGCQSVSESSPVRGAEFLARDSQTLPEASSFLRQGDNAETPTTYKRVRSGTDEFGKPFVDETTIRMGTVRDPVITLPPAPDWGKYAVAIIGAIAFIGGLVLLKNGWPKIGGAAATGGVIAMIIALTVEQWGWAYALAVLGVATLAVWILYSGYKSGLTEAASPGTGSPATSS